MFSTYLWYWRDILRFKPNQGRYFDWCQSCYSKQKYFLNIILNLPEESGRNRRSLTLPTPCDRVTSSKGEGTTVSYIAPVLPQPLLPINDKLAKLKIALFNSSPSPQVQRCGKDSSNWRNPPVWSKISLIFWSL